MEVMKIVPSHEDSYERWAHDSGISTFLLDLRNGYINEELRQALKGPRLERFIGVIYRPDKEVYTKAMLSKQFDAYVWIDETTAIKPLETQEIHGAIARDETYPFGL